MDNPIIDVLKEFYKENSNFLELKIEIDKWRIDEQVIFITNKDIKGKVEFSTKKILFSKIPHKSLPSLFGSKSYDGWVFRTIKNYHTDLFTNYYDKELNSKYGTGEYWFPSCNNGRRIHKEIILLYEKLKIKKKEIQLAEEKNRIKELKSSQLEILNELDKNGNGEVDVVEGGRDFNVLLKKHQKRIVEVDRNYVQKFVKVSSYLKTKKVNIQSIFNSIKDTPNQEVLNEYVEILKDKCHAYNLVLFNSLNMIVSLVEDDMITFYEIYEIFDTLNIFDSKHEKDVSNKLRNIGNGIKDLMYEVRSMGNHISNSIQELNYVTEESNKQLTDQLSEINSTIKVGNLINTINTYQNYKTNRKLN